MPANPLSRLRTVGWGLAERVIDTLAMAQLAPLHQRYTPWASSSLRPRALQMLLNEVVLHDRQRIVECGGGVSTLFLGRLMADRDAGQLLTIEHDLRWVTTLTHLLENEGLQGRCQVVHAPLEASRRADGDSGWYDRATLDRALSGKAIDLLFIDGPPAAKAGYSRARAPALGYFRRFLAEDFTVILDDINRPGEQRIFKDWCASLGLKGTLHRLDGGIGVIRTQPGQNI